MWLVGRSEAESIGGAEHGVTIARVMARRQLPSGPRTLHVEGREDVVLHARLCGAYRVRDTDETALTTDMQTVA